MIYLGGKSAVVLKGFLFYVLAVTHYCHADWACRTPGRRLGECIAVETCKPMLDYIDNKTVPLPKQIQDVLNQYVCSYEDPIRVCCPPGKIVITESAEKDDGVKNDIDVDLENPPPPPDVSEHPNLGLLPEECGYSGIPDRIRGGVNAKLGEFPWMALLSYRTAAGLRFKCGGTILNAKYILTAAHCVTRLSSPLVGVRIGEYDLSTPIDCGFLGNGEKKCASRSHQDLSIDKIRFHPKYSQGVLYANDIALIRIKGEMDLSTATARPVCLPSEEDIRIQKAKNKDVIVTGWGYTDSNGTTADILQKVELPVMPPTVCRETLAREATIGLTYKQICAGGRDDKDSCSGDSGGPMHTVAYYNDELRYIQQGVVSYGHIECGTSGFPGVYTRIPYYMDWILDNLEP